VGHKFKDYMPQSKIKHINSSPHYHESNGLAEPIVQIVKHMWDKERKEPGTINIL